MADVQRQAEAGSWDRRLATARQQNHGVQLAIRLRCENDLEMLIVLSDTAVCSIPVLGVELADCTRLGSGTMSLRALLSAIVGVIGPMLSQVTEGRAIVQQLWRCRRPAADCAPVDDWVPWTFVLEDPYAKLGLPPSPRQPVDGNVRIRIIPSWMDRLPYQLKMFRVGLELASPRLAATIDGGDWCIRLAEQAGRGIGSLTFAGPVVLATHMSTCFPPGHWEGKRVLELGAGAGMLSIFLGALGATVVTTDRGEYIELLKLNIKLNEDLLEQGGGSVVPRVLDWGATDLSSFGTFDYVIGADIVYPHEKNSKEANEGLMKTLNELVRGNTVGIIHHPMRGGDGELEFFESLPNDFEASFVHKPPEGGSDTPKPAYIPDLATVRSTCDCQLSFAGKVQALKANRAVEAVQPIPEETSDRLADQLAQWQWPAAATETGGQPGADEAKQEVEPQHALVARLTASFERLGGEGASIASVETFAFGLHPCAVHTLLPKSR